MFVESRHTEDMKTQEINDKDSNDNSCKSKATRIDFRLPRIQKQSLQFIQNVIINGHQEPDIEANNDQRD